MMYCYLFVIKYFYAKVTIILERRKGLTILVSFSYQFILFHPHGSTATGDHEHGTASANGFIIQRHAEHGIGAKSLGTLLHFGQSLVLGTAEHFLIGLGTSAHNVADGCKEISNHVHAENCFSCHYAKIAYDLFTINVGCCCDNHIVLCLTQIDLGLKMKYIPIDSRLRLRWTMPRDAMRLASRCVAQFVVLCCDLLYGDAQSVH